MTSNLRKTLDHVVGWQSLTPAEVLTDLSQDAAVRDGTLYTGKHLVKVLGQDAYRLVSGTINAVAAQDPLVADAQRWLGSNGLDFSDDATQAMLDILAVVGSWPAEVLAAVKAVGRPLRSKWTDCGGIGELPTEEAIAAEQEKYALEQWWASTKTAIDAGIAANELTTIEEVLSQAGE